MGCGGQERKEIGERDLSLSVDFLNYRNQSYRMIQISVAFQFPQRHVDDNDNRC